MDQEVGSIEHAEWDIGAKYGLRRVEMRQRTCRGKHSVQRTGHIQRSSGEQNGCDSADYRE